MGIPGQCLHPRRFREKHGHGWIMCTKCGKKFRPAVRHRSYAGYNRHQKIRGGRWFWPVLPVEEGGCGCLEAAREKHREYRADPEFRNKINRRGRARESALIRLRRMYPAEYAVLYAKELADRGTQPVYQQGLVPAWGDIVSRLEQAALDRSGDNIRRELEVRRELRKLRIVLADYDMQQEELPSPGECRQPWIPGQEKRWDHTT